MDSTATDDALAQRAIRNADAFAVLYRRHLHRVYSYLISRVGTEQDAQDLTAQTFLAALEGIGSYEPHGTFSAWLIRIARNKTADFYRQRGGQPSAIPLDDADFYPDDALPLDETVIQRLQMSEVASALNLINPDRAEALSLRVFGDLTHREIAHLLGKNEGAVKMLVSRALSDLRQLLNVKESEETL